MFKQPDIRPIPGPWWRPTYRLEEDYVVQRHEGDIVVPAGFKMDGSSEWLVAAILFWWPAGLLWLFGIAADGPHRAAAVVHDWMYANRIGSRNYADRLFYDLCVAGGMRWWKAWIRWAVLRVVGGPWWYT